MFLDRCNKWVGQSAINNQQLAITEIPLPPLDDQERIVAELGAYQKQINEHRKSIDTLDQKIQSKIASIWGE